MDAKKRKKVLIICGGGIFGAIPAHFLSMVPTSDLEKIDMLSGCSIGGILSAAYAVGRGFDEIDTVFQNRAKDCFDKRWVAYVNPMANPTYKNDSIDEVIREMVGEATVGDVRNFYPNLDLVIPSLNISRDSYKVWDNIEGKDDNVKLCDIAGYTSAAPSYYAGRDYQGDCIVDGGLIEVAPLLTATTALKGKRHVPFLAMDVLMLGTGVENKENPMTLKKYNGLSLLGIATDVLVPYVTLSNEMATRYWGRNIGYNSFNYFNPCSITGDMDDVSLIPGLIEQCENFRSDFLSAWNEFIQ